MPRLLVAVKSHFGIMNKGAHDVIRSTWGQAFRGQADVRFFLGRPLGTSGHLTSTPDNSYCPKSDETILNCPDDYVGLPHKVRGMCQWFVNKTYTHILLTDIDTCLFPTRVMNSEFASHDYVGRFVRWYGDTDPCVVRDASTDGPGKRPRLQVMQNVYPWASGAGYFLSTEAARIISDTMPQHALALSNEDMWVGQVLGPYVVDGQIKAAQLNTPICRYFVDNQGNSNTYDPRSGYMEKTWEEGPNPR